MEIKTTITAILPLAISTGKTDYLVDSDVLYDEHNYPYINERRLKGVLKEAVIEVLEIAGNPNKDSIVRILFGNKGAKHDEKALLRVSDAKLEGYGILKSLASTMTIPKRVVLNHYTSIIKQTAIDKDKKSAKKGSLRMIRAVKDGTRFDWSISCTDDTFKPLIQLALLHFVRIGSQRNHNLGWIKIGQDAFDLKSCFEAVKLLTGHRTVSKHITDSAVIDYDKTPSRLALTIKLTDKLLLTGESVGDQNTTRGRDYIDGRTLWGAIAKLYIDKYGIDNDFTRCFHEGYLIFFPAFIEETKVVPAIFQEEKSQTKSESFNLFDVTHYTDLNLRATQGYLRPAEEGKYQLSSPAKNAAFHFNREHYRRSGTSENGEIFYYDALEKEQIFKTSILGTKGALTKIKSIITPDLVSELGRSMSAEYGRVSFECGDISEVLYGTDRRVKSVTFYCTSPCLITNKYGYSEPNKTNVIDSFKFIGIDIAEVKIISKYTSFQNYSGIWSSMTSREPYYDVGTTFVVTLVQEMSLNDIHHCIESGLGMNTNQGYGALEILDIHNIVSIKSCNPPKSTELTEEMKKHPLYKAYLHERRDYKIKSIAIYDAQNKYKKVDINNNKISVLKELIESWNNMQDIINYCTHNKYKPISELLKDKFRWNSEMDHNDLKSNGKFDFKKFKKYMLHVLTIKRIMNNQKTK